MKSRVLFRMVQFIMKLIDNAWFFGANRIGNPGAFRKWYNVWIQETLKGRDFDGLE